eukprot:4601559-Pyramimonas_sp.AAC.1
MQKQQAPAPANCARFHITGNDETVRPRPNMVQTVSGDSQDQYSHSCADASQRAGMDPALGHPRCQRQQEVQHRSADALEAEFQAGVLSHHDDQAPG